MPKNKQKKAPSNEEAIKSHIETQTKQICYNITKSNNQLM